MLLQVIIKAIGHDPVFGANIRNVKRSGIMHIVEFSISHKPLAVKRNRIAVKHITALILGAKRITEGASNHNVFGTAHTEAQIRELQSIAFPTFCAVLSSAARKIKNIAIIRP